MTTRNQTPRIKAAPQTALKGEKKLKRPPTVVGKAARYAFSPGIGQSLESVKFAWHMFVNIVAQLFIMVDLIPKDHPCGVLANAKDYRLFGIVGIAQSNLVWDKKHIPQIVMFFAVLGFLIFIALSFITLLLSLGVDAAHADPFTSVYSGAQNPNEVLDKIFNLQGSTALPTAFGGMLQAYSKIVLVLAGIILIYTVTTMVMDTAHHGHFGGKGFNHTWAPIRLVVAMGLLIPLASGLNSGQLVVLYLARFGSEVATGVYKNFSDYIKMGQGVTTSQFTVNPEEALKGLFNLYACAHGANAKVPHMIDIPSMPTQVPGNPNLYEMKFTPGPAMTSVGDGTGCGYVQFAYTPNPTTPAAKLMNAQMSFFLAQGENMRILAQSYADRLDPTSPNYFKAFNAPAFANAMKGVAANYQQTIKDATQLQVTQANQELATAMNQSLNQMGWITVPLWINKITQANVDMMKAQSSIPEVKIFAGNVADVLMNGGDQLNKVDLEQKSVPGEKPVTVIDNNGQSVGVGNGVVDMALDQFSKQMETHGIKAGQFSRGIKGAVIDSDNPFMGLINEGRAAFVVLGIVSLVWVIVSAALGGFGVTAGVALVAALTPLMTAVLGGMTVNAIMLGFVLPLIPIMRFLSAVLGWIVIVLIGVLGMPLFALAHLKTGGEGWIGGLQVATAYNMVIGIILRPTLIVISFIVGMLLFNNIAKLFGMMIFSAASSFTDMSTGGAMGWFHAFIEDIILAFLLSSFMVGLANACFKLTETATAQAFTWMGTGALQSPVEIGDEPVGAMQKIGGEIGNASLQGAQGSAQAMLNSKKDATKPRGRDGEIDQSTGSAAAAPDQNRNIPSGLSDAAD